LIDERGPDRLLGCIRWFKFLFEALFVSDPEGMFCDPVHGFDDDSLMPELIFFVDQADVGLHSVTLDETLNRFINLRLSFLLSVVVVPG
jgi:hypothetical protein